MNKTERIKLERALNVHFKEIHKIYTGGDFREESFYSSLKRLIEECSKLFQMQAGASVLVLPRRTEAGIPDFRIDKNGEIVGYVEAKSPDTNLREIEDSEQLKRYRNSLIYSTSAKPRFPDHSEGVPKRHNLDSLNLPGQSS